MRARAAEDVGERRRVVVTGLGGVTALGRYVEEIWRGVVEGRSGIGYIRQFPSEDFPVRIGGEVDLEALLADPASHLPKSSRSGWFGLWALDRAWEAAGLEGREIDSLRAGVCIGASTFPAVEDNLADPSRILAGDRYDFDYYLKMCIERPELLEQRDIAAVSSVLAARKGLEGPAMTIQTACASATQAIGQSYGLIRSNRADLMVTGGTDSMMTVLCVAGFTLVGALASNFQDEPWRASRPFDLKRNGFVLAEGAGILVLEELEHALSRRAPILAEIVGYGSSSDGFRFTDVHPEGAGAVAAMSAALRSARLEGEQVDYINAHGTGTPLNDPVETRAIKQVFGRHASDLAVSSTKSQLGHLVCAAGGIETVICVLSLRDGIVPATTNLDHPDPECDLDYVPHESRRQALDVVMSNSFGFGGQNGTVVLRRWDGG